MSEFDRRRFLSAIASLTAMAAVPGNLLAFQAGEEDTILEAKIGDIALGVMAPLLTASFPAKMNKEDDYLVIAIDMKLKSSHRLVERFPVSDIEKLLAGADLMTSPYPKAFVNIGLPKEIANGFGDTDIPIPFCGKRVDSIIRIGFPLREINTGMGIWYEIKVKDIEKVLGKGGK